MSIVSFVSNLLRKIPGLGPLISLFIMPIIGIGITIAGPVMLTWSLTVDCKDDETCKTNKENTKWAGIVMTVLVYFASAFGIWSLK